VMVGGANLVGIPENLIAALHRRGTRDLTVISNTAGVEDFGVGLLIGAGQVRKLVANFVGDNRDVARRYADGSLELELIPSGTFAERIRAAGRALARSSPQPATVPSPPTGRKRGSSTGARTCSRCRCGRTSRSSNPIAAIRSGI
jgi:acyl CoA:acetate/3-ketoacid CoA transferase alpha subunit